MLLAVLVVKMNKICMLTFCQNRGKLPGISYFQLTENRYLVWMEALGLDPKVKKYSYFNCVCSAHFSKSDITITPRGRMLLSHGAIPCLNLGPNVEHRKFLLAQAQSRALAEFFPTNLERRKMWFSLLGFEESRSLKRRADICSDHFEQTDFDYRSDGIKFLKKDATPKLHCPELFQPAYLSPKNNLIELKPDQKVKIETGVKMEEINIKTEIDIKTENEEDSPKSNLIELKPDRKAKIEAGVKIEEIDIKTENEEDSYKDHSAAHIEVPVQNESCNTTETMSRENTEEIFGKLANPNKEKDFDKREIISLKSLLDGFSESYKGYNSISPGPLNINNKEKDPESTSHQSHFLLNTNIRVISQPKRPVLRAFTTKKKMFFNCQECVYWTTTRTKLNTHSAVHKTPEEKQKLKCCHCEYETLNKGHLRRHVSLGHNMVKDKYKCDQCLYQTADSTCFKKHVDRHKILEENGAYKCEECAFEALTKYSLERHVIKKHKNPDEINWLQCKVCLYKTTFRHQMKKHVIRRHKN